MILTIYFYIFYIFIPINFRLPIPSQTKLDSQTRQCTPESIYLEAPPNSTQSHILSPIDCHPKSYCDSQSLRNHLLCNSESRSYFLHSHFTQYSPKIEHQLAVYLGCKRSSCCHQFDCCAQCGCFPRLPVESRHTLSKHYPQSELPQPP